MLCRYDAMALKSLDIFSVHGFPVGLLQCESNLLGIVDGVAGTNVGSGGWSISSTSTRVLNDTVKMCLRSGIRAAKRSLYGSGMNGSEKAGQGRARRKKREVRLECGAAKGDSQEICFVPNGDYAAFLDAYLRSKGIAPARERGPAEPVQSPVSDTGLFLSQRAAPLYFFLLIGHNVLHSQGHVGFTRTGGFLMASVNRLPRSPWRAMIESAFYANSVHKTTMAELYKCALKQPEVMARTRRCTTGPVRLAGGREGPDIQRRRHRGPHGPGARLSGKWARTGTSIHASWGR